MKLLKHVSLPIKIKEAHVTCHCAPLQIEMRTENGRPLYARDRWGELTIHYGKKGQSCLDIAAWGPDLSDLGVRYPGGGNLKDYQEFRERMSGVLDLPENAKGE